MTSLTAVVVAASVVVGQAPMSNYEHLKEYGNAIVGKWSAEWETDVEFPGIVAKGDKIAVEVSADWILDNAALSVEWKAVINGKPAGTGKGITGWDRAAKRMVEFGFDSFGGHGQSITEKRGETWVSIGMGIGPDGRLAAGTNIVTFVDDDTQEQLILGRLSPDGKPLPNLKITYKRTGT